MSQKILRKVSDMQWQCRTGFISWEKFEQSLNRQRNNLAIKQDDWSPTKTQKFNRCMMDKDFVADVDFVISIKELIKI